MEEPHHDEDLGDTDEHEETAPTTVAATAPGVAVPGFRFATAACGMRFVGRDDLALIACDEPAVWAGVFTTSSAPGAPVVRGRELLRKGKPLRAVLVNAGIANAGTGKQGVRDAERSAALLARRLQVKEREVVTSSTGRIGPRVDVKKIGLAAPALVDGLDAHGSLRVARAMMTSDSVPKHAVQRCTVEGSEVTLLGVAKGSGMIAPRMATTLSFLVTDVAAKRAFLQESLVEAVGGTLNQLVIDGDTSTSDTCLLLASGRAGNRPLKGHRGDGAAFRAALAALCADLARQLARDGEAATKLIVARVTGARTREQARAAARSLAGSNLMKAAIGGGRLDWGRVVACVGASGAAYVHEKLTLAFNEAVLVRKGKHLGKRAARAALVALAAPLVELHVDLGLGRGEGEAFGCDLTTGYVEENSHPIPI
jgi:glutamate N-acetyltransferase/amino-acid N-acetyltransferase